MFDLENPDVLVCDLLAFRYIDPDDLARERELGHSCWWDYRGEHPVVRTIKFAMAYAELHSRFHEKYQNADDAEFVTGLYGQAATDQTKIFLDVEVVDERADAMSPMVRKHYIDRVRHNHITLIGLWHARQAADELGIPYRIYIRSIFDFASKVGWKRRPAPTHLYSDQMRQVAFDAHVSELIRYIPDFTRPELQAGSQAPFKPDFDKWLYELVESRKINRDLALDRMTQQGYITRERASEWKESLGAI